MPPMRWEYQTLKMKPSFWAGKVDGDELRDRLNELGAQGWELVAVLDTNMAQGSTQEIHFLFKRPKE